MPSRPFSADTSAVVKLHTRLDTGVGEGDRLAELVEDEPQR